MVLLRYHHNDTLRDQEKGPLTFFRFYPSIRTPGTAQGSFKIKEIPYQRTRVSDLAIKHSFPDIYITTYIQILYYTP